MNDAALLWLTQQIQQEHTAQSLWCSDENVLHQVPEAADWSSKPLLITNRYDVANAASNAGFTSHFSDFDFTDIQDNSLNAVFYRVSKEKPVVHHIINAAYRILVPGGKLFICGQKNEGIKTYIDKATQLFGCAKSQKKNGSAYTAILEKNISTETQLLDSSNYTQLRPVIQLNNADIYSKPGIFGWDKIDRGSEFLIQHLPALLSVLPKPPRKMLDLGCGYGYLSLIAAELELDERVLTDNNAAALTAARYNCAQLALTAEIIAADCGDQITPGFDLIVCNPPFHQGFSVDGDLTDKFIRSCKRLLAKSGIALFVVNQFIPLERKAREQHFTKVELLADNGSFKLITLAH